MKQSVVAAVRTGPGKTELTEYPMPEVRAGGALLKVEVAGICGIDVKLYANPTIDGPVIMGHENIGIVTSASPEFIECKGLVDGDRIFVEHYVG